ncbi:ABC transporter ATP-binding protein [Streptomyces sp. SID13588]|uniref:ABC transporter transmembrane domain-containing protein n=1 Tax=Streptomyces sp. SID13588 TaxID=2706051 RepID=UPI0013CCFDD1|nr:ABC transporter ATP-binding protein [Streptomyces sp. SID13588]
MAGPTTPPATGGRVLRRTTTRNARRLTAGTVLISLHQVCEALVPVLIGVIVDRAIGPGDGTSLLWWLAGLAGLFTVLTIVYRYGARTLMRALAEEAHLLRLEVAGRIMDPRGMETELRAGDLLTISSSDAEKASYIIDYIPRATGAVVATAVCSVTLLFIDVPLGIAVLVATPLALLALHLATPRITRRVAEQQEMMGTAASLATDLVSGVRPLQGIGAEAAASRRYAEVSQKSLADALRAARTQGVYNAVSNASGSLLACGIAVAAGWFALRGRITIGEFLTIIGVAQFLMAPVGLLAVIPGWIAEARASADRIARVVSAPVLHTDGGAPAGPAVAASPGLAVRGLRYGTLDTIDLDARPGEFVGIVAHRGADADALVRVLSGRVVPHEYDGQVLLGGEPLGGISLADARRTMLVEPHRTDLFEGTLAANLTAGADGDADPAAVSGALAAAAAGDVVSAHPEGLAYEVVERGSGLSGGQRQRVALARALLARPPILVLHDPTTAVDTVTEQAIAQGVRDLRHLAGTAAFTTVLVTNSPAMLAATDRVVVLDGGRVVTEGIHAELGATDDDYRRAVLR